MHDSNDSPPVETGPPAGKRRRSWRWLWLPAAAALLLVWWFSWRVPQYRLIDTYLTSDVLIIPAESGFLTRDSVDSFMLRDWLDGHPRWTVSPPPARPIGRPPGVRPLAGSGFSLSPDGHVFAAATLIDRELQVNIWRDGAVAGHVAVPIDSSPPLPFVKALDSGRVFCWNFGAAAVAVEGDRIIARGAFPPRALMAPDGSAIAAPTATGFDYAAVRVAGGVIALEHRYSSNDSLGYFATTDGLMMDSAMFAGGIVLADNGAVYGPSGQLRPGGEWRHLGMTPGGRHTLQFAGRQVRVFSPATGEEWAVAVPNRNHGGDATADGRHALAYLETRPPDGMMDFLRRYPAAERLLGGIVTDYLVLYRQPGRRVALLRPRLKAWWPDADIDSRWWFPSPDGRGIAMTASAVDGARCFLLRY